MAALALLCVACECSRKPPGGNETKAQASGSSSRHGDGERTTADPQVSICDVAPISNDTLKDVAPLSTVEHRLVRVLEERMVAWRRPDGSPIYVTHCQSPSTSCPDRVKAFASLLARAAWEHGIDPFLLAAIAVRESGLDPAAVGPRGSVGILQLHPEGVGATLRATRDASYRTWCARHRVDGCQQPVVTKGAEHLAAWIDRCGDTPAALGGYNSGRCDRNPYARRVLHTYKKLCKRAARLAAGGEHVGPASW